MQVLATLPSRLIYRRESRKGCIHARALFEFLHHECNGHDYTGDTHDRCGHESKYYESLNAQIAHVTKPGRPDKVKDRLGSKERFNILRDLREEWARFKQSRTERFASLPVKDVVKREEIPTHNTTTGVAGRLYVVDLARRGDEAIE